LTLYLISPWFETQFETPQSRAHWLGEEEAGNGKPADAAGAAMTQQ
jgi:hypothetical protein